MKIAKEGLTQNAYELTSLDTFTQDTDKFALAIHIFKLLMNGFTPFNGIKEVVGAASQASPGQGSEAVKRDSYCFKSGNKPMAVAVPPLAALPPAVGDLFTRAFIQGRKNPPVRPSATEWDAALAQYESSLKTCGANGNHQYYHALNSCPWCEADARYQAATR
jgi:DNA-binding helix-hairpin-helix protein with protein kinase domain